MARQAETAAPEVRYGLPSGGMLVWRGVLGVLTLAFVAGAVRRSGPGPSLLLDVALYQALVAVCVGSATAGALWWRRHGDAQTGVRWWIVAALGLWWAQEAVWAVDAWVVPVPWAGEVLNLAGYGALLTAVVLLLRQSSPQVGLLVWLDAALLAVAALAAAWALLGDDLARLDTEAALPALLLVAMGAALLGAVAMLAVSGPLGDHLVVMPLLVGVLVQGLGDVVYVQQVSSGTYVEGSLLDATWLFAGGCFAVAAQCPPTRPYRWARTPLRVLAPAVGAVALAAVVLVVVAGPGHAWTWVMVAAFVLVVVRFSGAVLTAGRLSEVVAAGRTDELTGLLNRRGLLEALDHLGPADYPVSVTSLHVGNLRTVNDSLGFQAGDQVLAGVGRVLVEQVDGRGLVARSADTVFTVVVRGTDPATVRRMHAEVTRVLADPATFGPHGVLLPVQAGVVVQERPEDGRGPARLLRDADVAVWQAERDGRPGGTYDPGSDPFHPRQLALARDLLDALRSGSGLSVALQPLVDLSTYAVVGAEVLVRWTHPTLGAVDPSRLIPLAETSGLMPDVTRFVLDRACEAAAALRDGGARARVWVNLSAGDLADPELPETVLHALASGGLPPSSLGVEITEQAGLLNPRLSARSLRRLRSAGVGVAIDDFGTGYSSLAHLRTLPITELKLDRTFLVPEDGQGEAVGAEDGQGEAVGTQDGQGRAVGAEDGQAGSGPAGSGLAGSGLAAAGRTGSGQAGSGMVGSGMVGSGQAAAGPVFAAEQGAAGPNGSAGAVAPDLGGPARELNGAGAGPGGPEPAGAPVGVGATGTPTGPGPVGGGAAGRGALPLRSAPRGPAAGAPGVAPGGGAVPVARVDPLAVEAERAEAFVSMAVDLARSLRVSLVVEGVETPEQLRMLRRAGAGVGQGFLLGRPGTLEELLRRAGVRGG